MDDIRLKFNFLWHFKTKKLIKIAGAGAVLSFIKLLVYCAQSGRYDGILSNMDAIDIELVADWDGEEGAFIEACLESRYFERLKDGLYAIHDFEEHQPWIASAKNRSDSARKNVSLKWGKSDNRSKRSQRLSDARKKGRHTKKEWDEMTVFFNNKCVRCGSDAGIVKDHIIPIYQGGSDSITNIQPLCNSCNSSKGPDNTDHRILWCVENDYIMPTEWLPNAYGVAAPSLSLPSLSSPSPTIPKEEAKSKSVPLKRHTFTPPTLSEVTDYCKEKSYTFDPEKFHAFYESKGWMIGKNKMKSWKAACTTWHKSEPGNNKPATEPDVDEFGWTRKERGLE